MDLSQQVPAVLLIDPKFPHNVGGALRACTIWGVVQLGFSGTRVYDALEVEVGARLPGKGRRLPREERMREYRATDLWHDDRPLDRFVDCTPVAVEFRADFESLFDFQHPEDAVYVFGPEDDSLGRSELKQCHRFVRIPSKSCLNLAAAVNVVLYDRAAKLGRAT